MKCILNESHLRCIKIVVIRDVSIPKIETFVAPALFYRKSNSNKETQAIGKSTTVNGYLALEISSESTFIR